MSSILALLKPNIFDTIETDIFDQRGVLFFSPCLLGPVGDPAERLDFLATAFSETAPLDLRLLRAAWFLPPLESLVDWGMAESSIEPAVRRDFNLGARSGGRVGEPFGSA